MTSPPAGRRGRTLKLGLVAVLVMALMVELHLAEPDLPWLRRLELVALDLSFRLRGAQIPGSDIVIVMIDDSTVAALGHYPVPRRSVAELLDILHDAGAKVVALDILFADPEPGLAEAAKEIIAAVQARLGEPERAELGERLRRLEDSGDEVFAQAMRRAGNVVLPFAFRFGGGDAAPAPAGTAFSTVRTHAEYRPLELKPSGLALPIPPLAAAAAALGHGLVLYDVDGSSRFDYPAIEYDLDEYPSIAVRVMQLFQGLPWPAARLELGRGVVVGNFTIETDPAMRFGVNYRGPPGTFPTYSFAEVVSGTTPRSVFRDRMVLVGANVLGSGDVFRTPFTASLSGVERLATVLDTIIRGDTLRRPIYAPWLEALCMLGAALAIGLAMARLSLTSATLVFAALLIAGAAAAQLAFIRSGLWFAQATPAMALVITFIATLLYRYGLLDKDYRRVRHTFARYLAPAMVERLAASGKFPELGGELREITVLFCDLRGFSGISERLDPAALTRMVNDFFAAATEAIQAHGGTIDKYIGDAIMALWNAPVDQPNHAELACRAALAIGERMTTLNARRAAAGEQRLTSGIGIATGFCTVGNFGSTEHVNYSVLGDTVNIAARLEGETKAFGVAVIVGPETASHVPGFALLPLAAIRGRGRTQEIEVAALVGDETLARAPAFAELQRKHGALREALAKQNWPRASALAVELVHEAPAELAALYRGLETRIAKTAAGRHGR
jgi:adenylate cyclase